MGWLAFVVLAQLAPSPVLGLTATATTSEFAGPGAPRFEAPTESAPNSAAASPPVESAPNSAAPSAPVESAPNSGPSQHSKESPSDSEPDPYKDLPVAEPVSLYRNPGGKFQVSGGAGFGVSGGAGARFTVGAGLGYGIVDGVLPGIRGLAVLGEVMGAELAATLTLTPPVAWQVTPFAVGEVGRRFQSRFTGWIYGGGGGVYLGQPGSVIGFQLGYIWRRLSVPGVGTFNASTPIVNISARF